LQPAGVRGREQFEELASFPEVGGQGPSDGGVLRCQMSPESSIQFTIVAEESFDALGQGASCRIEILPEGAREVGGDLRPALRQEFSQAGKEFLASFADRSRVQLAGRLP